MQMMHDTATISHRDVVDTILLFEKDRKNELSPEGNTNIVAFASHMTGLSEDTLFELTQNSDNAGNIYVISPNDVIQALTSWANENNTDAYDDALTFSSELIGASEDAINQAVCERSVS